MTDHVYINQNGQFAQLEADPDATGVGLVDTLDEASVISDARWAFVSPHVRNALTLNFTALSATEHRTVSLETGTQLPGCKQYVAGKDLRQGDPVAVRASLHNQGVLAPGHNPAPGEKAMEAGVQCMLRSLLKDARGVMQVARRALSPDSGQEINRTNLRQQLDYMDKRITEELER